MEEEEREGDEEMVTELSSRDSKRRVTLVIVKGLLQCIHLRDRVPPLRVTSRFLPSTGSGDPIFDFFA